MANPIPPAPVVSILHGLEFPPAREIAQLVAQLQASVAALDARTNGRWLPYPVPPSSFWSSGPGTVTVEPRHVGYCVYRRMGAELRIKFRLNNFTVGAPGINAMGIPFPPGCVVATPGINANVVGLGSNPGAFTLIGYTSDALGADRAGAFVLGNFTGQMGPGAVTIFGQMDCEVRDV